MSGQISVQTESLRLDKARQTVAALRGAREEIAARLEETTRQVAVAKGRIALKGRIDAFLEELQAEAHKRNVGSFERLLTLLAQDVLPGSSPIGLELSTERGLPSLDIFARHASGVTEDIFLDKGGAMTNVVSVGLRVIASVKSGGRRLLVLDEPDCWIKPGANVSDFYRVLRQVADQVGVQCLVISHHSHAQFGEGIELARLENDDGITSTIVSSDGVDRLWTDDTPGFRAIRLTNFQQHASSELRLSPRVTALIGPNDRGKSSLVRALAAALYGDGRESLIRHGESSCTVEIDIENGRRLTYTRHRRRNPLNMWTLTEADGSTVEEDGVRYETGGRNVPDWIGGKLGVAPVDDLRIHVSNQKTPIFLLDQPPAKRASVLSVGQETSHLKEMIVIQRERVLRDQQTIRDGEREVTSLSERLSSLGATECVAPLIEKAAEILERIHARADGAIAVETAVAAIERMQAAIEADRRRLAVLDVLPSSADRDALLHSLARSVQAETAAEAIATLSHSLDMARARSDILGRLPDPPQLASGDAPAALVEAIEAGRSQRDVLTASLDVLRTLPDSPPALRGSEDVTAVGKEISQGRTAAEAFRLKLTELDTEIAAVEGEMAVMLDSMGNLCPTCGQPVTVEAFLRDAHHKEVA